MNTKIVKLEKDRNNSDKIREASKIIDDGGIVAFPTETVYGLGADALNNEASVKIYEAKGRPSDNPLIVHIAETKKLHDIVDDVPQKARKLMEKYWPGPLTMIFFHNGRVPKETTGGLNTVAVRMPDHPVALSLIKESRGFIAAPSANISGRPSPTKAEHVIFDMDGRIEMILDGGMAGIGIESTIIDFTDDTPVILRPGYITKSMIEEVIGPIKTDPALSGNDLEIKPKAPGMKYKHYAPKAELIIVDGEEKNVVDAIGEFALEEIRKGKTVGVIASDETVKNYKKGIIKSIGARKQEDTIANQLYGILREFDDTGVDIIYSESFDTPRIGQAIMNRLIKAAGYQIIKV